jgi:adenylylsulfate kinase
MMLKIVQPGFAVWLTGLPSSGKTTVANILKNLLSERDVPVQVLDSDNLRQRLTPHLTYVPEDRAGFYDLLIFLAQLLTDNGVNVIIAATASRRAYRKTARAHLKRFAEVFLDCSPDACRSRDPKRLWEKADKGEIGFLPGVGEQFEPPESPEVRVDTGVHSSVAAAYFILKELDKQNFWAPL